MSQKKRLNNNGVTYGESHANSVLTEEQVNEMRRNHHSHGGQFGYRRLGDIYGCGESTVRDIIKRKTWTHLPDPAPANEEQKEGAH